jgi:hypothetical protein
MPRIRTCLWKPYWSCLRGVALAGWGFSFAAVVTTTYPRPDNWAPADLFGPKSRRPLPRCGAPREASCRSAPSPRPTLILSHAVSSVALRDQKGRQESSPRLRPKPACGPMSGASWITSFPAPGLVAIPLPNPRCVWNQRPRQGVDDDVHQTGRLRCARARVSAGANLSERGFLAVGRLGGAGRARAGGRGLDLALPADLCGLGLACAGAASAATDRRQPGGLLPHTGPRCAAQGRDRRPQARFIIRKSNERLCGGTRRRSTDAVAVCASTRSNRLVAPEPSDRYASLMGPLFFGYGSARDTVRDPRWAVRLRDLGLCPLLVHDKPAAATASSSCVVGGRMDPVSQPQLCLRALCVSRTVRPVPCPHPGDMSLSMMGKPTSLSNTKSAKVCSQHFATAIGCASM